MKSLDQYWNTINPVSVILWPVSLLFQLLVRLRCAAYSSGIFKSESVDVPVIIVGNINVGGSGKTPLIIHLVKLLQSWGYTPGVISRGYGGTGPWPQQLDIHSTASSVGDEPVQIFQRTEVAMVVGPDRVADARLLIDRHKPDVILTDDGLQHYRLKRDLELIVVDKQRGFGNGFMLPAGPLREPVARLRKDPANSWVIVNGDSNEYGYNIKPVQVKQLKGDLQKTLTDFSRVHAVAGIGYPERFFSMLEQHGIEIIRHPFPDHHAYTESDFTFNDDLPVLMTQKDSVKCQDFADHHYWFVEIDIELSEKFLDDFKQKISELCHG